MAYIVTPMEPEDLSEVAEIEKVSFATPWPISAYRRELQDNHLARYIVVRDTEAPRPRVESNESNEGLSLALRRLSEHFLGRHQRQQRDSYPAVGYAGIWMMADEAHVTTIAVHPQWRSRGLGELLFSSLLEQAREIGAQWLTLEVRASNIVAQRLYRKYGLKEHGVRRRYYTDNGEDAIIMWSEKLDDPDYRKKLAALREALQRKLASVEPGAEQPTLQVER